MALRYEQSKALGKNVSLLYKYEGSLSQIIISYHSFLNIPNGSRSMEIDEKRQKIFKKYIYNINNYTSLVFILPWCSYFRRLLKLLGLSIFFESNIFCRADGQIMLW